MEQNNIDQFKNIFNTSFDDIIDILDLGVDTDDDGIYHYIHKNLNNVYSFDSEMGKWLDKNKYKNDILQRINVLNNPVKYNINNTNTLKVMK